ncbi:MAG: DUF1572 family protein [Cellulophaga sp.]
MNFPSNYIKSCVFEFNRYKTLGDATFKQLNENDIHWQYNEESNSIALIVKHIVGNMLSRWTNFLTEDGEKPWRNREYEFRDPYASKKEMLEAWEEAWLCLFLSLSAINENNFTTSIKIRNETHTIPEAVNRQLAHYANHVGQLMLLGKMIKGKYWNPLSIPKGGSEVFNKKMFSK